MRPVVLVKRRAKRPVAPSSPPAPISRTEVHTIIPRTVITAGACVVITGPVDAWKVSVGCVKRRGLRAAEHSYAEREGYAKKNRSAHWGVLQSNASADFHTLTCPPADAIAAHAILMPRGL